MGVVLRSHPRRACSNMQIERRRRRSDGLVQGPSRFFGPTELSEHGSQPTIGRRVIREGADCLLCCLDGGFVFTAEIAANDAQVLSVPHSWSPRIEADAGFECRNPLLRAPTKDQGAAK